MFGESVVVCTVTVAAVVNITFETVGSSNVLPDTDIITANADNRKMYLSMCQLVWKMCKKEDNFYQQFCIM